MLDTEPLYKRAWQQAARDCGYQLTDEFYLTLVGRPTEDCERELLRAFGARFPLAKFQGLWPRLWEHACESEGIAVKPGLEGLLAFFHQRSLPIAVATSSDRESTAKSLRRAGLEGRFEVIVTRDQVENGKPAPDLYLEAARRLRVLPSNCVAFEDSDAGLIAATRAGMTGILIPDLKPPTHESQAAAYRILESLDQVPEVLETLFAK